jgi:hypothetical protein
MHLYIPTGINAERYDFNVACVRMPQSLSSSYRTTFTWPQITPVIIRVDLVAAQVHGIVSRLLAHPQAPRHHSSPHQTIRLRVQAQ